MGDFSRDPKTRLADSFGKHYVGVRLQQGVPVLDADWNELDDLRRIELEELGRWTIGNGVPVGNDGFRIMPIAAGGVATIVIKSKLATTGQSSVEIDLAASTAASALGFDTRNSSAARFGSSPAQITSNKAQPFVLSNGSTLVIRADGQAPETVTFAAASFVNIAAATAAEVAAVVVAAASRCSASAGTGNDFIIKGGDGTTGGAGRILVAGRMVLNERYLKYSEQPLYKNAALAQQWGVTPVAELVTPAVDDTYVVYLDVWHREVGSVEDAAITDERVGVETALRLRREWAVRLVRAVDFLPTVAARPEGHAFYPLAQLQRSAGIAAIADQTIVDQRDNETSLRREVAYRGTNDVILVDSLKFDNMLISCRDNIRDFMVFLTSKFVTADSAYLSGEVLGLDSLSVIASIAEQGVALLNAKSLDTKGAFGLFQQLLNAENRFVSVWKTVVFPINKASGQVYKTAYTEMVGRIEGLLTGPAPGGYVTVSDSVTHKNLAEAVHSQEQINMEFGQEIARPIGFLTLTYLGSVTPTIVKNQNFDLRYKISGSVTPDDDIDVEVYTAANWATTLRNSNGTLPFNLRLGPGSDDAEFLVTVTPPNVDVSDTTVNLLVFARHNKAGLSYLSPQKALSISQPPPPSEADYSMVIVSTNVSQLNGVLQVPVSLSSSHVTLNLRLNNNTNTSVTVDLEYAPLSAPPWTIQKGSFDLPGQTIPAHNGVDYSFRFVPPNAVGNTLSFSFRAKHPVTHNVMAEIQVTLTTVAG